MPTAYKFLSTALLCVLLAACTQQAPAAGSPTSQTVATAETAPTVQVAAPTSQSTAAPTTIQATSAPVTTAMPTASSVATAVLPTVVVPPFSRELSLKQPAMQGDDVLALQQRLSALNYTQLGRADGVFGKKTQQALLAFQAINQLGFDGIVNENLWRFLFDAQAVRYDLHPIVAKSNGFFMGATNAGAWLEDQRVMSITGELEYATLRQQGVAGSARGSAPRPPEGPPCETTRFVEFTPPLTDTQPIAIAGATWNPLPRPITEVPTDTVALQKPVASALRVLGLSKPVVRITRALRGDLDGDGQQETIVAAFYRVDGNDFPAPSAEPGDYAAVLVIPDNSDVASVIDADVITRKIEFGAPLKFTLIGIWDLNGDGKMEVVANSAYYEGEAVGIYTLEGTAAKQVLTTGCGV